MNKISKKNIIIVSLLGIFFLACVGGSFYGGFVYGLARPKIVSLDIANIEPNGTSTPLAADFNLFWQAWDVLRNKALRGAEPTNQALIYGAISGLIGSLDDPHSVFLPPDDSDKFEEDVRGFFGGVGLEIGKKNGDLVVIAPLKDTPADRAGMRAEDKILKIDETITSGLDVEQAVKLIRGEEGTEVKLLVYRESWEDAKEIMLKRERINVSSVAFEMKDNAIAYIELNNFSETALNEFYEALRQAANAGARGVLLDLRNNPGGFLEVAVRIAGWFLPEGTLVVSEEYRDGTKDEFHSSGSGDLADIPTVVLINGGSASAAEILAGALRDHGQAKLIGETTFGKGTVQTLEQLTDGSSIKITIAHWVLPKGGIIDRSGIQPDIEIKLTDEDIEKMRDPQLLRAIEELKKEIES